MEDLTIGGTARLAGVGVETIRFYERRGLIEQPKAPRSGGYRRYPADCVQRISFIKGAQELGFSLKEISQLLDLRADPGSDCGAVQRQANEKLAEVEQKISQLKKIGAALKEVIAACPSQGQLAGCTIMAAMARPAVEKVD